ncbi:hypothetical protein [Amycolatopsis sp. BJA-103]|uniref:hypothetical protein n=1 Tax=Amycolatopsis sp. BJA-103 TaxID=1911175 RepID=UPI000C77D1BD|nr:hypothetical protein [Amycolatopsis sp. BJA-103]AUI61352.1 hypothetical protein BKN51_26345 [Amycolatopsis sp. BJA-103]PNE21357.1 hypothetical protein B1H26_06115 [Amycolatopsis sp. BJA-103]
MDLRETEVVTRISANIETDDFTAAAALGERFIEEFEATELEICRADPEGGWKGYTVSVGYRTPPAECEEPVDTLHRAAVPALFHFGLNAAFFEIHGTPETGQYGSYEAPDTPADGYTLYALMASVGGTDPREPAYVPRHDFTPREDTDVISRVHLYVPTGDLRLAVGLCGRPATDLSASLVRISTDAGPCEAVLLSAFPAVAGESGEEALSRVTNEVTDRLSHVSMSVRAIHTGLEDDPFYTEPC